MRLCSDFAPVPWTVVIVSIMGLQHVTCQTGKCFLMVEGCWKLLCWSSSKSSGLLYYGSLKENLNVGLVASQWSGQMAFRVRKGRQGFLVCRFVWNVWHFWYLAAQQSAACAFLQCAFPPLAWQESNEQEFQIIWRWQETTRQLHCETEKLMANRKPALLSNQSKIAHLAKYQMCNTLMHIYTLKTLAPPNLVSNGWPFTVTVLTAERFLSLALFFDHFYHKIWFSYRIRRRKWLHIYQM